MLTKTQTATRHLAQHAPTAPARHRAQLLHDHLTTAPTSPALLRQAVIAIRDLAGQRWLATHADHPDVRAFTHLDTLPSPPPEPILDGILARCLQHPLPRPRHRPAHPPRRHKNTRSCRSR
jgi:hypothetical protein